MMLVFAAGGTFLWLRDRSQIYLLGYVAGPVILGISFVINHYVLVPDGSPKRVASGMLSIAAVSAIAWAACKRLEQPVPIGVWFVAALGPLAVMILSDPLIDATPWLFAVNGYCGIIFVMSAQSMAMRRSEALVDRLLIWVFAIIAAQFFVRPLAVIMIEGPVTSIEYRESMGHALYAVTTAILTLILTGSVLTTILADQFKMLKEANKIDPLSGLMMRNAFEHEIGQMVQSAHANNKPMSMIIADIDHFKRINDRHGHAVGDEAIRAFGAIINRTIRPNDRAGRVGGEEFCIVAWDCAEQGAVKLAERLRSALSLVDLPGTPAEDRLSASFGVAQWGVGESYAQAFRRADDALYAAKGGGRDQVAASGHRAGAEKETRALLGQTLELVPERSAQAVH